MNNVELVFMHRDGMTEEEARDQFLYLREKFNALVYDDAPIRGDRGFIT